MKQFDKQLKYSIRKVSVGAASVVIGAFYFAMGAGVVHAETNATIEGGTSHSSPSPESNTNNPNSLPGSNYQAEPAPNPATLLAGVTHSVKEETETKTVTRIIKYVDASDESKEVATPVTQTVSLTRKKGTEEWTTGKWEVKTAPTVDGYDVSGNNTVEAKEVTSTTEDETVLVYYSKKESASSNSSSTSETTPNRSRRVRRNVTDGTTEETSDNSTEITVKKIDPKRKGETLKPDQPGVTAPKQGEEGGDDQHAHLKFKMPDENATVEELWKIVENLPDDFQNNERSYLRNMDTLGDNLRFDKNGNVTTDSNGVKLQPGEIKEISSFGGWTAIMKKDGETGKFAIGMKNEQGYFTGWYNKDGKREEGGMLGSDALDRIYLHEQALDRRFKYMLMLAKGRTIANKDDKAQDGSTFKIETENKTENKAKLDSLPVKEREDILQHSPNIEGFNGMEKTFTAFSTEYGSRLKIEFVTGYISDYEGSKGTYRIVVKAIKKDKSEETIYDHTINRIDGVVENEERYAQGVDLKGFNKVIKDLLKAEYNKKVTELAKEKYKKEHRVTNPKVKDYAPLKPAIEKELAEKGEAIVELPVDKDELHEVERNGKPANKFKDGSVFTGSYATVANTLNTELKKIKDTEVKQNSPIWDKSTDPKGKDPDRVYKLLNFVLPTAKKIIYHADTDQLELETDPEKVKNHRAELEAKLKVKQAELETADETKKTELNKEISALKSAIGSTNSYTYTEARNGSKEAKILGSLMEATTQPSTTVMKQEDYEKYHTNKLAAEQSDGLPVFTRQFVEKENVTRDPEKVISDEKLSEEITKAIGGDEEKLGKGGYFSTGDIPLGKDVVAYKIQVFAENEKRVGVNKQSPRLQYNLPILADFSVIQDTVNASKEVTKRILTKLKEKGKITEEEEKKIKDKIDKSKKTSELRSAMSGNVKVRYVDKAGNVITNIKNDNTFGEKDSENRYTAAKDVLINSEYNVADRAYSTLSTTDDKFYRLVADNNGLAAGSAETTGTIGIDDKVVTFVYEETAKPVAPTTGKGVVHFKKQVSETAIEPLRGYDDITLTGNVGDSFSSTDVDAKITELERLGYEIVTNEFATKSKTIDSTEDVDGQEPSQVYDVVVKERITTNTETKKVTRTIKYVKIDSQNGVEVEVENAQETNTTTVNFTRDVSTNQVTKKVTYGTWSEKQTLGEVKTPVLTGYIADRAKVESTEVTADSTDIVEKVVYRKIGSWIPKKTGEKTPTPIPYPNDPTDPTKPKYPDYPVTPENPVETPNPGTGTPEKPKIPVIPYVEGYEPKIPTDPTKPVGEDNLLKPLVPIDSNDPKKGYKVPELPEDPKKDTVIEYKPNPQKILIKVVNVTTGEEVELPNEKLEFNGVSDQLVTSEDKGKVDKKIKSLQDRGYIVSTKNPITATTKYDTKDDSNKKEPTQTYKIVVNEPVTKDTEVRKVTRTIKYVKIDVQDGKKVKTELNTKVDKVEFSRDTTTSLATGLTKLGAWDQETKELPKVNTPVLDGYLANVASVENKSVSPDTESYEVTVEYRKIGSWVPKVPDGVTPPTGTDITPIPYPNNPDDPTKPKNPEYPETPGENETPGTPEKPTPPVIPYVPGYTPKIGEEPLKPVDPKHPEKGYKVPPVPTTPNDPKTDTPIEYAADSQKAVIKFVVVGEDGTETELVTSRITTTGRTGQAIPTKAFNEELKKLTGDPVNNGDYELVDNPLKDGETFDTVKDEEGKDPSQVFTVKLRQIYVIPPTPRIVERPSGNTVEVDVPNKDADTLSITFTKRDSAEKETIVTKKDKDGTWKIEKAPDGVTINPTDGRVYIPSEKIQPKTLVDTQTKHKYKFSKVVSVMPNISDVTEFKGITVWMDESGNVLKPQEKGIHTKEDIKGYESKFVGYEWKESVLEGNKVTHIFKKVSTPTPYTPGEPTPENPTPQPNSEHPSVPTPSPEPDTSSPETPVSPDPEVPTYETGKREELPNTGTEANAGLASAGIMTLLAGLGLGFFKKKEDEK